MHELNVIQEHILTFYNKSKRITQMKFTVQSILSLPVDGASSHILTCNTEIKILLDCGISRTFDFTKYLDKKQQLKKVCLVLISHSQLEYSGAIAFLVDQIGMDPKIFYTTQPIMRYSPLNVHQELLNMRSKSYTKKVFNKIYKIYESINIIKPLQKKSISINPTNELLGAASQTSVPQSQPVPQASSPDPQQQQKQTITDVEQQIFFTCYTAGSHMGSLAWRLSFGKINIVYMIEYNNYSLYHINGLDIQSMTNPIDIFITDTYRNVDDLLIKKQALYNKIKQILSRFYESNGMSFEKPPVSMNLDMEKKIVFSCYPNQMLVQIMAVVKKIIEDIQSPQCRQKIRVVHLSSRFLQLIKSQMDYFSPYFKDTLQNIQNYFIPSKQISGRINITTFSSLQGLLCNSVNTKPIEIYYFGPQQYKEQLEIIRMRGQENIGKFKLLSMEDKLAHSASKIDIEMCEQKQFVEERRENSQMSEQKEQTISQVPDQVELIQDVEQPVHQPLHSKYFSQVGFPRFNKLKQEEETYDDYGRRHVYARFNSRRTYDDYKRDVQMGIIEPEVKKKNSTIQIMNIQFKIPTNSTLDFNKIKFLPFYCSKTNFNSSLQLITALKPLNVILINSQSSRNSESLSQKYQQHFKMLGNQQSKIYDLAPKNYRVLQLQNELISYKVNYIAIPQQTKLQKIKGLIKYNTNNTLYIHLDCLQEKEHLNFRLDKFYKKLKSQNIVECIWTSSGLLIDGVKLYREDKKIVLEGEYSEQYFKVRRLLYQFLDMN